MNYFIYILECQNGTYYTGYTTDIIRRYQEHCKGTNNCKYTRSFPPIRIAACWEINNSLSITLKIENLIKKLSKKDKKKLVEQPRLLENLLVENNTIDRNCEQDTFIKIWSESIIHI